MTTESTFSNGRRPPVTEPRIRGYRHIYRLAIMESALKGFAALQQITGEVNRTQIAFIAIEYASRRYTERSELDPSCLELATSVERLALQIDAAWWDQWIQYERTALARKRKDDT